MTKEEEIRDIQERMLRLDEALTEIRTQLDHAKARRINYGEHANPEWSARANSALRHKGRERQQLQNRLGELNRAVRAERKAQDDQNSERAFIRAAKAVLSEDMYRRIWQEVERAAA
jgi:hypothetical protein